MMTLNLDQVRKTVSDLLRLSENDAASQGEVDNAVRFARRLMDAHHLSEEDCRTSQQPKPEVMTTKKVYGYNTRFLYWEKQLVSFTAKLVGSVGCCQYSQPEVVRSEAGIFMFEKCAMEFYGPAEDCEIAADLYNTLYHTVLTMAKLRFGKVVRGDGRAYAEGFVVGLFSTLEQVKRIDMQSSSDSRALIVRSDAIIKATRSRAEEWMLAQIGGKFGKPKKMARGKLQDAQAWNQGRNDGEKAKVTPKRKAKVEDGCNSTGYLTD